MAKVSSTTRSSLSWRCFSFSMPSSKFINKWYSLFVDGPPKSTLLRTQANAAIAACPRSPRHAARPRCSTLRSASPV
jgi:hypothetical protein